MNLQAKREVWRNTLKTLKGATPDPSLRVVLLAAHPDDETIGASALLAKFPQTSLVYLTDGAPRNAKFWSSDAHGSREEYAAMRRAEAQCALSCARIPPDQIAWLGGIDQEAIHAATTLTARFAEYLSARRPDVVLTHPYEGGHPDHDTAALVASAAISHFAAETLLLEMTSYHARAGQCVTGEFLDFDPAAEIEFELTDEEQRRKRQMLNAHASQHAVLAGFSVDRERFRPAPAYDFSKPPHEGRLWYECMHWPMTGSHWRSLATAAIREMQECNAAHSA